MKHFNQISDFYEKALNCRMHGSVHGLIDDAASRIPEAKAWHFIESRDEISYAGLSRATRQVAAGLSLLGVGSMDRVAVQLPNVPEFPLSWIGIGRLGAVMVPVNYRYSPREVAYVISDSGANLLVTTAEMARAFMTNAETADLISPDRIIVVDGEVPGTKGWADIAEADPVELPDVDADALLNIQYTSGTTGFPKGCMLSHDYWLVLSAVVAARLNFQKQNVLVAQPFFYMDPQWTLAMSVRLGGTLVVAPGPSISRFMGWVREYDIGFCSFPELLAKEPPRPDDADNPLRDVVIYGVPGHMHADVEKRFGIRARDGYGMTEIGSAIISPFELENIIGSGSCGIASPFRELSIRDPEGNEVPVGQEGELWVRGRSIMQGYWQRPDANAQSFGDGGWFRTGDLFCRDEAGLFYITGRLKDMIRRSSENIAAREVEVVSVGFAGVREAAAVPVPDEARGQEVKIYLVPEQMPDDRDAFLGRYFEHCQRELAPFKIPRFVEFREALPKTVSEKIAKQDLINSTPDLRVNSYDRVDQTWR